MFQLSLQASAPCDSSSHSQVSSLSLLSGSP